MTGRTVNEGALYYASSRRRRVVPVTDELRSRVLQSAAEVRAMLAAGRLPGVFLMFGNHGFGVAGPGRLDECGAYDVGHELLLGRGVREPLRT